MMTWLEGKTVWSRSSVWVAVDGESVFVAEGEAVNARARVVKAHPSMFTDQPPQAAGAPR